MTYEQTVAFFKLGLSIDSDRSEVKRAYAKKLRICSPETNPKEWMLLHDAYEKALSAFDVHNVNNSTDVMINEDIYECDDSENDYVSFFQDIEQLSSESESKNKLGYTLVKLSSIMTLKLKHRVKHDGTLIINGIELQKPQKCLSKRKFRLEIPEYINGYPVTEIGETAFSSCYILKEIKIPEGVTKIGRLAFSDCVCLEIVEIPDSLITIEDRAFEGCDSLRSITLPSGLNEVGEKVFAGCIFLKNVHIPSSIDDHIAKKVFSSYKFFSGIVYDIGEGFELVDADNCFERVHSIREAEYVFKDSIAGVELEIINAGRERLGLTDSMLAKKILAVSPLIPKNVQIERNLEVYRDLIWCVYSYSLETPVEGALNFFSGLIVFNSYVLHVSSLSQYIYDDPDVERRRNVFGIYHLVKSLRPKIG